MRPQKRRQKRSSGGYTLIEITLSLLVMALGLSSILAIFPVGIKIAKETKNNATAPLAAMAAAEQATGTGTADDISGYYFHIVETPISVFGGDGKNFLRRVHAYTTQAKRDGDGSPYSKAFAHYDFVIRKP